MSDEKWRERALCAQTDPDMFFPEKGGSAVAPKKICAACPVKFACLEDALDTDDVWDGIRGGMSPTERRALRRPAPVADDRYPLVVSRTLAGYSDEVIARELEVHVRTVQRIRARRAA